MIFSRKKKDDKAAPKKEKQRKTPKKKEGGKILRAIGLDAERAPEEKEIEKQERHAKIILAWKYLRDRIDKGCLEYLKTGSDSVLREHVQRPALDTLLEHLNGIRSADLLWAQPDRAVRSKPEIEVISEKLNSRGQPASFIIRESFFDNSILRKSNGEERQAKGSRRVIQATVEVENGQEFRLISVLEVKGATL